MAFFAGIFLVQKIMNFSALFFTANHTDFIQNLQVMRDSGLG